MSEKVVITKEQAETIELFFERKWDKQSILKGHMDDSPPWKEFKGINGMEFDNLAKALYIGYVVKKTPEEMVLMFYQEEKKFCNKEAYLAIERTLHLLGIEIEGVNK